jgi:hypothetical protein
MNAEHVAACPARQTRHRTHDPTRRRHPAALDEWAEFRGPHRPTPHPRTRTLTDFLRHTWATGLANAGMSLQALMALLGHVTPQMTIRYATLASPTLRTAYDQAMGKMRRQFTLTPVGKPVIPDKMSWLNSEMLKTRVTHGYCSRHAAAGACPLRQHLRDLRQPRHRPRISRRDQQPDHRRPEPARRRQGRSWDSEAARHARVADSLTDHLPDSTATSHNAHGLAPTARAG